MLSKRISIPIYVSTLFFFAVFFFWPIYKILRGGLFDASNHFSPDFIIEVFKNNIYIEGLTNALGIAVFSTLFALLIAIPLARVADRYNFPAKGIFMGLALLPIMLPPFVGAIGIRQILSQYGIFNVILEMLHIIPEGQGIDWLGREGQFWGVVIVNTLSLYPILYLNTLASLSNIDPAMEEAAQNLGCRRFKKFFTITLPLIRPGLFAGGTIVFIWSFTELGVPLIFDFNRVTSVQIFNGLKDIGSNPFAYALVIVMLAFSLIFYILGKGLFGRNPFSMLAKASPIRETKTPNKWGQLGCIALFTTVSIFALLPHLSVIIISFSTDWYHTLLPEKWTLYNYQIALGNALTIPSIQNSLFYSSLATILNVTLGIGIALVLVRSSLPGRFLIDALAMLPLAVPGLVMAFGYLAMTQKGTFFAFLNPINNPTIILIIAYSIRKLPFIVRSAVAGLEQTSITYEEAAQNLGCSPLKSSFKITFPLILANLIAGCLLVFSQTMLEVSDSLLLAQKQQFYPITKAIYELLNLLGDGPFIACALGVWAMSFLAITILGASTLLGKALGSIFKV